MVEEKKIETRQGEHDILVLSCDLNEITPSEIVNWAQTARRQYKDKYDIIILPKTVDLKYCSKQELWELLDLYKISVKIIEGILHE